MTTRRSSRCALHGEMAPSCRSSTLHVRASSSAFSTTRAGGAAQAARASVSAFLAACECVPDEAPGPDRLPICRDEDDQKFLMLASRGRADMLLTRDRLLLDLARSAPFPVLAPEVLASLIASATASGHCVACPRGLG